MMTSPVVFARFAALALFVTLLSAASVLVIERLGVPSWALAAGAAVVTIALVVVSGLVSGTMRLPEFLTQNRALPSAGVTLATAALLPFGLPGQPALGVAAGLVLAAFLLGPVLRRSGAPTWPCFLGTRYGSPALRVVAAAVLAAAALGLGAAALGHAADVLARLFTLTRPQAAVLGGLVLAFTSLPGGSRSQSRAGVALALVVATCAAALWATQAETAPERMIGLLSPLTRPGGAALAVGAALSALAFPAFQTVWPGIDKPADMRLALLWASITVCLIAFAAGPASATPVGVFGPIAMEILSLAASLAAAGALLLAAGQAMGFDFRPRIDRRRTPASARFALIRFATLASIALAAGAVGWAPGVAATQAEAAAALTVGALLPPILLGVAWDRATAAGGFASLGAGLVVTLALIDGRLEPSGLPASAGVVGCAVGLAAGAAASLFTRRSAVLPRPLTDDML
ncbi:hypothetical protein [Alsobacter metallidurans]|nr:hypothetical protein [Alsobacter metallidurans]